MRSKGCTILPSLSFFSFFSFEYIELVKFSWMNIRDKTGMGYRDHRFEGAEEAYGLLVQSNRYITE